MPPHISIVAPCYNEEEVLPIFHKRVTAVCQQLGHTYEIILVDDGSRDRTWEIITQLAATDPQVHGHRLSRNFGHQLALSAGLTQAEGQYILIIDADLQDPPELLPDMLQTLQTTKADVLYAQRRSRPGESAFKKSTASLFYRVLNLLSETSIPNDTGDFRLITRPVLNALIAMPEQHRFIRGMVSWVGFRQKPYLYDRQVRAAGETHYPFRKMFILAINAIASFSVRPLRLASYLGLGIACLSGIYLIWIIVSYFLFSRTVPGWASIIVTILFMGSIQLIVLGIVGEYIGRIYIESKRRPLFFITETTASANAG
jgi:glycosyltransferase involved in cell wall biosynthesis